MGDFAGEAMRGDVVNGGEERGAVVGDLSSGLLTGRILWGGGIGVCSSTFSSGSGDGSFNGVGSSTALGSGLSSRSVCWNCCFLGLRLPVDVILPPKLR